MSDNYSPKPSKSNDGNVASVVICIVLLVLMVSVFGFDSLAKLGITAVCIIGAIAVGLASKSLLKMGNAGVLILIIMAILIMYLVFYLVGQTSEGSR